MCEGKWCRRRRGSRDLISAWPIILHFVIFVGLVFCFGPKIFRFLVMFLFFGYVFFYVLVDDIWRYLAYTRVCLHCTYVNRRGGGVVYSGNSFLSIRCSFYW